MINKINITENSTKLYFWHSFLFIFFVILVLIISYIFHIFNIVPTSISIFDFIILILAVFRSTRLFVYDEVTNFIRDFFSSNKDNFSKTITELLNCPWCTGVWMSLFLSFIYFITPYSWFFLFILAIAWFAALIQVLFNYVSRLADKAKNDIKK